jgi:predicted RNA-binding protein with RPS1 domain
VVKNITDYGAFVDLGGIDGLLHVTDIAWRRVNHPSEVLSIGQTVKVQIIRINQETHRISLGMKQLESRSVGWHRSQVPGRPSITGRVTNITDYGAFVELEPGIEGLIHVSEMSWTKKNVHPGKILSTSQEVEVVSWKSTRSSAASRSASSRRCENPWEAFAEQFPAGTEVEGEVKNKTEFGLFIGLEGDVDGMVHLSDLDWNRPGEQVIEEYNKGDMVKAVVLDVDVDKERISLGIKQLGKAIRSAKRRSGELRKNAVVSCQGDRGQGWWPGSGSGRSRVTCPSSAAPTCRVTATSSARSASRSARRSTPASPVRQEGPQGRPVDQGAGNRRREGSRRHSSARPTPAHRSATFSVQPSKVARTISGAAAPQGAMPRATQAV